MWPWEVTLAFQVTAGNSGERQRNTFAFIFFHLISKTGTSYLCWAGLELLGLWVPPTVPDCNFHFLVVLGIGLCVDLAV